MSTSNTGMDAANSIVELARAREEELQRFVAAQPQTTNCKKHPHITRTISLELTRPSWWCSGSSECAARYEPCPVCAGERAEAQMRQRLHDQGVPQKLLHAALDSWNPDDNESEHLDYVRQFIKLSMGFLILIGKHGTGKSHLAVAAMRHFQRSMFVTQGELLNRLRQTYGNQDAIDPISQCQDAALLVLDEIGVGFQGRDLLPLLHEVLDHRHKEGRPTILTSNLGWDEFQQAVGQRIADRLKESTFRVLKFNGKSHRSAARESYFSDAGIAIDKARNPVPQSEILILPNNGTMPRHTGGNH